MKIPKQVMAFWLRCMPSIQKGFWQGLTTYRMYITTPNDNDVISAVYGDDEAPLEIATTTSFYQHEFGSALGSNINPLLYHWVS